MENSKIIFSTGVHLQSVECVIDGKKQWRWVAVGFEDESFLDGKAINPLEYAEKQKILSKNFKTNKFFTKNHGTNNHEAGRFKRAV